MRQFIERGLLFEAPSSNATFGNAVDDAGVLVLPAVLAPFCFMDKSPSRAVGAIPVSMTPTAFFPA
jgi:hypothetical protein